MKKALIAFAACAMVLAACGGTGSSSEPQRVVANTPAPRVVANTMAEPTNPDSAPLLRRSQNAQLAVATPAGGASTDRVGPFGSVVAVAMPEDFPAGSLMRAECSFVQRVERPDGSAKETQVCDLTTEPALMIPENQGVPPNRTFIDAGGECTWTSDYWWNKNESEVLADSFRVVVTPSGKVHATSTYPATPLDCPDE